jgi:hypothetical protein
MAVRTQPLHKRLGTFNDCRLTATWRSGYAAVCKTVYPGSIPGVASNKINDLGCAELRRSKVRQSNVSNFFASAYHAGLRADDVAD